MLKQRRAGVAFDLNASEIASAVSKAKTPTGKARAAISGSSKDSKYYWSTNQEMITNIYWLNKRNLKIKFMIKYFSSH